MPESEPTRQAESKIIPPPRTDIVYPEVAAIPPGGKAVVVIPKSPEVVLPKPNELPVREAAQDGVTSKVDITQPEPRPRRTRKSKK